MLGSRFSKAVQIVGIGITAGNISLVIMMFVGFGRLPVMIVVQALVVTSGVMPTVALLACIVPARRALRINPTDALRQF